MAGTLTAELWQGIAGVYAAILEHPFVTGLTDGTLPEAAFGYYVVQDALYLREYARTLAVVAAKAPDAAGTELFARHAAEIITVERALHDSLMDDLGLDPAAAGTARPAPTTLAYTSYLLATSLAGSYAEGVGVVLPCYWIYYEVGRELVRRGSPDPRYRKWIDTYAGDEYGAVVQSVRDVADRLGPGLGPAERALVGRHFQVTSQYEWMFWDAGYRREQWPLTPSLTPSLTPGAWPGAAPPAGSPLPGAPGRRCPLSRPRWRRRQRCSGSGRCPSRTRRRR